MNQLFGKVTTVHNMTDTDGTSAYKPSLTVGNPELKPESADMWNIGMSWIPEGALEGLQVDLDYYDYEYEDIFIRESYLTIVGDDVKALKAAVAGGQDLMAAINAGVGNRDQVLRTGTGKILRVLPRFVNQNSAEVSGLDAIDLFIRQPIRCISCNGCCGVGERIHRCWTERCGGHVQRA